MEHVTDLDWIVEQLGETNFLSDVVSVKLISGGHHDFFLGKEAAYMDIVLEQL